VFSAGGLGKLQAKLKRMRERRILNKRYGVQGDTTSDIDNSQQNQEGVKLRQKHRIIPPRPAASRSPSPDRQSQVDKKQKDKQKRKQKEKKQRVNRALAELAEPSQETKKATKREKLAARERAVKPPAEMPSRKHQPEDGVLSNDEDGQPQGKSLCEL